VEWNFTVTCKEAVDGDASGSEPLGVEVTVELCACSDETTLALL